VVSKLFQYRCTQLMYKNNPIRKTSWRYSLLYKNAFFTVKGSISMGLLTLQECYLPKINAV